MSLVQEYPSEVAETRILTKLAASLNINDDDFINVLVKWSSNIRDAYKDDTVTDLISTRRLIHIMKSFAIFNNRLKAVEVCITRFDEDTYEAFKDFYTKLDAVAAKEKKESGPWDKASAAKPSEGFDAVI